MQPLILDNKNISNRLLMGSGLFQSPEVFVKSACAAKSIVITVSLRREMPDKKRRHNFHTFLKDLNCIILPNTAGCRTAKEAITVAEMAREVFETNWIKLEVIGDDYLRHPDPFGLLQATKELIHQGFFVLPFCTEDYVLCDRLVNLGCDVLMPWGSPIGSGQGVRNWFALNTLRKRFPQIKLIVDAGLRKPSDAARVLELGYDAVLVNSAIALAVDPVKMATAFSEAVSAGRNAYEAGIMPKRNFACPSTPDIGKPFSRKPL